MKRNLILILLPFLLILREGYSASCLSCHVLKGWSQSSHARFFGANTDRACLMCHTRHPIPIPATRTGALVPSAQDGVARGADSADFAYLRGATIGGITQVHNLCFQCHTSSVHNPRMKAPDIYDEFDKIYLGGSAMPLVFTGHRPFLGKEPGESLLLGSKPDELPHIECTDCHNPHFCNRQAPLRGARGIDIHGDPVNPLGDAQADTRGKLETAKDYEVCFRCHGDSYQNIVPYPAPPYVFRPPSYTNKRAEFDPDTTMRLQPELKNNSFHPVVFPGKDVSKALEEQLSRATEGKLGVSSTIRCGDCHNSDAFRKARGALSPLMGTYAEPEGPHGSLYKRILRAPYSFKVGDEKNSPFTKYDSKNFALCYNCHDEKAFDGGARNAETGFYSEKYGNLHYLHLTGAGGKLSSYESCAECHYNVHSNVETDTTKFVLNGDQDTHLLWFYPGVEGSGGNAYPEWMSEPTRRDALVPNAQDGTAFGAAKKSCAMVCHAHQMDYSYGGR